MTERVLRLGAYNTFPSVAFGNCKGSNIASCSSPGSDVEVARSALQIAGIPFVFVTDLDINPENILLLVQNGTIDMAVTAMRTTDERKLLVDFSMPINYYQLGFLIHNRDETKYKSFVTKPFTLQVWAVLLSAIAIASFIRIAVSKSSSFQTVLRSVWLTYAALLGQSQDSIRRKQSDRAVGVLIAFWLIGSLLIITYYQALMKSILMAPLKTVMPFRTLQEVLDRVEYDGWTIVEWKYGPTPLCNKEQCQRLKRFRQNGKVKFIESDNLNLELRNPKTLAWLGWEIDLAPHEFNEYEKDYIFIKDRNMIPEYLAFAFNKGLDPYRYSFNNALLDVLLGQQAIRYRYQQPFREYRRKAQTKDSLTITLYHLREPILMLLISHGISIALFILEIIVRRCYKRTLFHRYKGSGKMSRTSDFDAAQNPSAKQLELYFNSSFQTYRC